MPPALNVPWDVIRVEFSHGVSQPQLAAKYGVKEGTIAARAARQKWMQDRPETHVRPLQDTLQQAAKSQGQSLQEAGQAYAARTFAKFSKLVDQSNLPPPKSYKDVETADKIARRSAGLENIDTQVTTVIGIGDMSSDPVIEAEIESETVGGVSGEGPPA